MIFNIIIYVLLLLFSLCAAVFFNDRLGYTPFLFLTCLTFADVVYLFAIRFGLSVSSFSDSTAVTRGGKDSLCIKLSNRSRLFIPYVRVEIKVEGECLNAPVIKSEKLSIGSKSSGSLDFNIIPYHVGSYKICLSPIKLYDFLGVFSVRCLKKSYSEALVLPEIFDAAKLYLRQGVDFEDGAPSSLNIRNDQSRENYSGVRNYAPGDPLRSIHWKLTAHVGSGDYMTRVYENSRSSGVAVVADLNVAVLAPESRADIFDCLAETAVSAASYGLLHGGHAQLYFNCAKDISAVQVTCAEELPDACKKIARAGYGSVSGDADAIGIINHVRQYILNGNIIVCTFRPDEALALTLSGLRAAGMNPLLIYTVTSGYDKTADKALFNRLDKYGVEYRVINSADELSSELAQA